MVDGVLLACLTTSHLIMAGIFQDANGLVVTGFYYIGEATSLEMETYGLLRGFKLVIDCGYLAMEIEMNSLLVYNTVQGNTGIAWKMDCMIQQIKKDRSRG
ncbi:hypothetical protein ACH5RR_032533 [Cinchona calisaya]|uniref:RNase H type-1 domain-containing protein n=1 Tax=Cinchona calisaya TaxID=153742 RepID=A0ABD2YJQ0_9GENT